MKKLSNAKAELKKSVAYKKKTCNYHTYYAQYTILVHYY